MSRRLVLSLPLFLAACGDAPLLEPSDGPPADAGPAPAVIEFRATTTGPGAEPYLYAVEVAGSRMLLYPDSAIEMVTYPGSALLLGVPPHCAAAENPAAFTVPAGAERVVVQFQVRCEASGPVAVAAAVRLIDAPWIVGFAADGHRAKILAEGRSPVWSPDGSRLAYVSTEGGERLQLLDPEAGSTTALAVLHGAPPARPLAWSLDGRRIAVGEGEQIRLQAAEPGGGAVTLSPGLGAITDIDWSPAGDSLVVVSPEGISIVAVNGSGRIVLERASGTSDFSPSWSPAGGSIAFARRIVPQLGGSCFGCGAWDGWGTPFFSRSARESGDTLMLAGADGSAAVALFPTADQGSFAWSPDGSLIALTGDDGWVRVVSPSGAAPPLRYAVGGRPSWTADGRLRILGDAIYYFPRGATSAAAEGRESLLVRIGGWVEWRR